MGAFKDAHGGQLRNLYLDADAAEAVKRGSGGRKSWDLTERQLCDLELLMNGGFSPLEGFLGQADYEAVLSDMRLASGILWPIPITLDVTPAFAEKLEIGETIDLRDREGVLNATMTVTDRWQPDKRAEALAVFGSEDRAHPAVRYLLDHAGSVYLGGRVQGVEAPMHYDFKHLRDTPQELRDRFRKLGWRRVIAFQTRNPMHRAHQELTFRAAQAAEANLLIQPVVGMTKPGDVDHFTRVRCYEKLLHHYPEQTTSLSLLPLAMRMAGPREAVWHAIIRKNYGCTHLIVGRDHAGPGDDSTGKPFYGPYAAQELFAQHQDELDVTMVPFHNLVFSQTRAQYVQEDQVEPDETVLSLSGTELRRRLQEGLEIPEWFCSRGGRGVAPHPPAAPSAGIHRVLHRPVGLGQVDHRQRAPGQALGAGRPAGDPARRRSCQEAPVQRARLLARASRPQHPAHRLRRQRDHQERRHRALRADRPLCRHPQQGPRPDRAHGRISRGACRDLARGLREPRPRRALCQGTRGDHQGVHRHLRPLRGAREPGDAHRDR